MCQSQLSQCPQLLVNAMGEILYLDTQNMYHTFIFIIGCPIQIEKVLEYHFLLESISYNSEPQTALLIWTSKPGTHGCAEYDAKRLKTNLQLNYTLV